MFSFLQAKALLRETSSALSLIYFNIRSLRRHHDDFVTFLSTINHAFIFICSHTVMETCMGYQNTLRKTAIEMGDAVVELQFRSVVPNVQASQWSFISNLLCESAWLQFNQKAFSLNIRKRIVGCIYRSPSSYYSYFPSQLRLVLSSISSEN